ncbi:MULTISPECIES: hypothetical protein [unclassified Stenotrophomonas]|jgi:hypothetical protein|uniref:InvB/SpaK family type III secretion system chaperone n=1 Tax=unclassified Stenotrophomonas TaxID=196198 RepID=UPI0037103E3B
MTSLLDTLNAALQELGCDPSRFQFDTHSSVVMGFADVGELLLDPVDDLVYLWGRLETSPAERFSNRADELLTALSAPAAHFANGCLALRQLEEGCLVGGALQPDCQRESSLLAAAIEGFHARVLELQGLLR